MNRKTLSLLLAVAAACSAADAPAAGNKGKTAADSRWFLSGAFGYSRVKPKTDCDCYKITDDNDAGFSLALGYDLTRYFSVEGYYADLGAAEVSNAGGDPVGSVGYRDYGITALAYFYNQSPQPASPYYYSAIPRQGLSLYGRLGVGAMKNSTELPYERDNNYHFQIGAGAEYGWKDGFALRAELTAFDEDAALLNIGLVKRFGSIRLPGMKPAGSVVLESTVSTAVKAEPAIPPARKSASRTHALLNLSLPVIHFQRGSDALDPEARAQLDRFARDIARYYKLAFVVKGYTDNSGDEYDNLRLSLSRAVKVKNYLISKGISPRRLSSQGLGSNDPVADNKTRDHRLQNHRVEFAIR
ncbi:MAG TPA: OmpA family protein [Gammaproteobacteria bacterium]|nr:OmpA family protein [Gammaproteobacteria bacterium]